MEGISFVVRIRNEEEILEESIRSLFQLKIPHEIILILHLCTDRSREIAEKLASEHTYIKILEYNIEVSRPGYETLCTSAKSKHSIMTYYNWCFSQANYCWKFKWDADFIATDELIEFLNNNQWKYLESSTEVYFHADSGETSNSERYLCNGTPKFNKYFFWEAYLLPEPTHRIKTNIRILHKSKLSNKKPYWQKVPWFYTQFDEEAKDVLSKYIFVEKLCGKEINGMARASNEECHLHFFNVKKNIAILEERGIEINTLEFS